MSVLPKTKPLVIVLGATFALGGGAASAAPFEMRDLPSGYMVAEASGTTPAGGPCVRAAAGDASARAECDKHKAEGKCGEGKCGGGTAAAAGAGTQKAGEMKCGEGKCGAQK